MQRNIGAITNKQTFNRVEVGTDTANVTVTVQAESDMFTFPLDASGAEISVEGQFRVVEASVEDYAVVATGVALRRAGAVRCVRGSRSARACRTWTRTPTLRARSWARAS